jgi:NAD(P) transhydrogenase subunit alpha
MEALLNMLSAHEQMLYFIILSVFVGIVVIGGVPTILHTPLMSGANAIHGVVIVGALIVMLNADADNYTALTLGFLALRGNRPHA